MINKTLINLKTLSSVFSLILSICYCNVSVAQQYFSINLDRANLSLINPANMDYDFFYNKYLFKATAVYKDSWTVFDDAPRTTIFNGEAIKERDNVSLIYGGQMYTDRAGRFRTNNIGFKVATVFSNNIYKQGLSIGLSINLSQYILKTNDLNAASINIISEYVDDLNMLRPNIGLGLFYYRTLRKSGQDHFIYSGFSAPIFYSLGRNDESEPVYNTTLHLFYNGGYVINLQDESYLEFSTFSKYESTSKILVSDLRAKYNFRGRFETQIGYALDRMMIIGFGAVLNPLKSDYRYYINYTGNYNSNPNSFRYFGAFHEITLSVAWGY